MTSVAEHEHDWQLAEVGVHARGAERLHRCACGAESYQAGQAATEIRPSLDG